MIQKRPYSSFSGVQSNGTYTDNSELEQLN